MPRYVAFLRGVSPMNARMPELKRCLEDAGFSEVKTVLSSGNAVFTARELPEAALEDNVETALQNGLGRTFPAIIRSSADLQSLLAQDPFPDFGLPAEAKRVVTFLRTPPRTLPPLPLEREGARILAIRGREAFTAYVPNPRGPIFMTLIEQTFGKEVTTRTWETVRKCAFA